MVSEPIAVLFILAVLVFLALQLEQRFRPFKSLGAASVGLLLGMVLSNLGILPGDSPTYNFLIGPGVSTAVVLMLISVDLRSIKQAGPAMLKAFGIGVVGTTIGSCVMAIILFPQIGPETWKLSGQFTGTYTGGGMNFAAVGTALGTSSSLYSAAVAADVIITAIWMITCLTVPVLLGYRSETNAREMEQEATTPATETLTLERALYTSGRAVPLMHLAALVAIAIGAQWFSSAIAGLVPILPSVLWLTTIALLTAQIPFVKKLSGGAMLGNYFLLLFLASNGAQSVIANIIEVGPAVFWYALGTVTIHGAVLFGVGRLAGIDPGTLSVASQANVGGPASAIALAGARGYTDRLLPGVAVGLLGYAVGNYLGILVANIMKGVLIV